MYVCIFAFGYQIVNILRYPSVFRVLFQGDSRKNITHMLDLPKDPMMLFSVINMRLRDVYPSLDALCEDLHVDRQEIIDRLKAVGFEYNAEQNKFW